MRNKIRASARGRECQIRIPGVCNSNPETTVLCHLGGGGMGAKRSDLHGAYGCSSCHDEIDRRTRVVDFEHARLLFLEGIIRTQEILLNEGLINVKS